MQGMVMAASASTTFVTTTPIPIGHDPRTLLTNLLGTWTRGFSDITDAARGRDAHSERAMLPLFHEIPSDDIDMCVRCSETVAILDNLCGHCVWALKAEAAEGIWRLEQYLAGWARFDDWCQSNAES